MTIEPTALLMDVKKFAVHDGPGIRTTLFLKGCPLACVWCHNPEGISPRPEIAFYAQKCVGCGECIRVCPSGAGRIDQNGRLFDRNKCQACGACADVCLSDAIKLFGKRITLSEAAAIAQEDEAFYRSSNGGVTVSGGEPLLQADFVRALFDILKSKGLHTAVDTCGCVSWEAFERVLPVTDLFLYDVKHIDPSAHRALTGRSSELILDNLRRLSDIGARIEIRIPLVPGCNADDETLRGISRFLSPLTVERVKILPYHALARSKYAALGRPDTMPLVDSPDDAFLDHAVSILKSFGVNAVSGCA